jgi:hypothetical protein
MSKKKESVKNSLKQFQEFFYIYARNLTDLEKPKIRENEPETSDSIKSEGTGREQIEENVELLPT